MSDLRDLMDGVTSDLATVRWPSADELRRRVRRRRARTTAAVAGAVIAVTVGVAGLAGLRAAPPPPPAGPSPIASVPHVPAPSVPAPDGPAEVEIPQSVLLTKDEAGAPDSQFDEVDAFKPVRMDEFMGCQEGLPAQSPRYAVGVTHLTGTRENRPRMPFVLGQEVYRFAGSDADGFLRDLRAAVVACGNRSTTGDGKVDGKMMRVIVDRSWSIAATGFTADDALVVRLDTVARKASTGEPLRATTTELAAYVRTGDLVTRISAERKVKLPELRRLATLAGGRLCAAAQPRC